MIPSSLFLPIPTICLRSSNVQIFVCSSMSSSFVIGHLTLLLVTGRDPKNLRFYGFASLVKFPNTHLLKQARQLCIRTFDSALCEHYISILPLLCLLVTFCSIFVIFDRRSLLGQPHHRCKAAFFAIHRHLTTAAVDDSLHTAKTKPMPHSVSFVRLSTLQGTALLPG